MLRLIPGFAVALLLVLLAPPAVASPSSTRWQREVARVAEARLSLAARSRVRFLLAGGQLESAGGWPGADARHRRGPACTVQLVVDHDVRPACRRAEGTVVAIEALGPILGDAHRAFPDRALALRYLVRLVADLHDPGATFELAYERCSPTAVEPPGREALLTGALEGLGSSRIDPALWSAESLVISDMLAVADADSRPGTAGAGGSGPPLQAEICSAARKQAEKAGSRLASVLNALLGHPLDALPPRAQRR